MIVVHLLLAWEAEAQNCKGNNVPRVNKKGWRPDQTELRFISFDADFPQDRISCVMDAVREWNKANQFTEIGIQFTDAPAPPGAGNGVHFQMDPGGLVPPGRGGGNTPIFDNEGYVLRGFVVVTTDTSLIESCNGFRKVALHEIGHLSGLADLPNGVRGSVMSQASGKDDANNHIRYSPSTCDALQVVNSSRYFDAPIVDGGGSCPAQGCGHLPFPQPCSNYNGDDGWCYPDGYNPEAFPDIPPMSVNLAPRIVVTEPSDGSIYSGSIGAVTVGSADDGRVQMVKHFLDGQNASNIFEHPFSRPLGDLSVGQHTLYAQAFDNTGLSSMSTMVVLTVISDGGAIGVRFFDDALYGGPSLATGTDLPFVGTNWNDRISSITVPSGRFVTIYADANYGGASLTLTQSVDNLTQLAGPGPGGTWNDAISSIRTGQNCLGASLSPTSISVDAAATTGSVNLTYTTGCSWNASSDSEFVTVTSGTSGSGSGTVGYSVSSNPSPSPRSGTLTIAGLTFTVNQGPNCSGASISPASVSVDAAATTGSVNLTHTTGCSWTASSDSEFVTVTSGTSGSGSGTVGYSVSSNPSPSPRSGTLTIAGLTFTVNQGPNCSGASISPAGVSVDAAATIGSVSLTHTTGCSWTASSDSEFLTVTSGASGSSSGTVGYSVSANTTFVARSGTITIGGLTFTVNQGPNCSGASISPTSASAGGGGGTGSVNVTQATGCSWNASSNSAFVAVSAGGSGSGNGAVEYWVATNPTFVPRSGSITIASLTFTINQARAALPTACELGSDPAAGTVIMAAHITQLRTCIGALRATSALSSYSWTEAIEAQTTTVKAVHLTDLRAALSEVYTASSLTPPDWGSAPASGTTLILAGHFISVRDAIRALGQ